MMDSYQTVRSNTSGQALIEMLISAAVLILVLFSIITTVNFSLNTQSEANSRTQAIHQAENRLEQARAARNKSWNDLIALNQVQPTPVQLDFLPLYMVTQVLQGTDTSTNACAVTDTACRVVATVSWVNGTNRQQTSLTTVLSNNNISSSIGGSMVGYWKFNELSGTTASDSSGNGNTGTLLNGPTWVAGKSGNAVNFDGVVGTGTAGPVNGDDVVDVGSPQMLDDLHPVTLEAWIYPESAGENSNGRIFAKTDPDYATNGHIYVAVNASKQIAIQQDFSGTDVGGWLTPTNALTFNTAWYHVAITYDATSTANWPTIYINGVAQTLTRNHIPDGTVLTDAGGSWRIGNHEGSVRTFDGSIDEVRIYNYIRSPGQVIEDMNSY